MKPVQTPFVCRRTDAPCQTQLPSQFFYVNQDNFVIVPRHDSGYPRYLYSDSATSCVILVMQGHNAAGEEIVMLSHTSGDVRSQELLSILDDTFVGPVWLWLQGANPPDMASSKKNIAMVEEWLERYKLPGDNPWYVEQAECFLGEGDPRIGNRGEFGVDLRQGVVSNRSFQLSSEERDPTLGVQSLFTLFGRHIRTPLLIWDATQPFPEDVIDCLVVAAFHSGWTSLLNLDHDTILNHCSTTPDFEPDWFVETLLQSARFVKKWLVTG
ncbi:MAG: hypothetical protein EP343_32630 [Deltaproteobacteria bacterium]|nr:MAG: hypothetical protein EP343_32630 [Deltaproteobacteria bacterium]